MDPKKLVQERIKAVADMRALLDKADTEKRDLSAEELEQYDKLEKRCDAIVRELEEHEAQERRSRLDAHTAALELTGNPRSGRPPVDPGDTHVRGNGRAQTPAARALELRAAPDYADAFWQSMRYGERSLTQEEYAQLRAIELRVLTVGTATAGAELVPTEFERTLVETLREENIMRSLATIISTAGDREIPVMDGLPAAGWVAEGGAVEEDDPTYAQVVLGAHKGDLLTKVSEELVEDSAFDMPTHLAQQFGGALGALEEIAFVNGDGSGKPTGAIQGASAGITFASNSAIAADELFDMQHSVKRRYRNRSTWLVLDSTLKAFRKLKDTTDQYIWQPGLQAGQPDTLLGRPIQVSDGMPAIGATLISVLFGDFRAYWIADRTTRNLQRLDELYRGVGQIGFRMYFRVDGKVVLAEAIKKGTHPA